MSTPYNTAALHTLGCKVNFTEKWKGLENEENKDIGKYEGEIKNGSPNGQGNFTLNNGEKYVG